MPEKAVEELKAKKTLFACALLLVFTHSVTADDLVELLQGAVQTACLGMYSTAQTGVNVILRYDDPPMMANRFARMSGNRTRTITFYGVCFDCMRRVHTPPLWGDIKGMYPEALYLTKTTIPRRTAGSSLLRKVNSGLRLQFSSFLPSLTYLMEPFSARLLALG